MSSFQKKIIEQYSRNGYTVIKLAKTNYNGIADLLAGNGSDTVLIECKEKKDTVKKLQVFQNKRLSLAFGWRFIILQDGRGEVDYSEMITETTLF